MKIVTVKMAKVMRATARMTRKEVVSADLAEAKAALDAANEEASADLTAGIALVDNNYIAIKNAIEAQGEDLTGIKPSGYAAAMTTAYVRNPEWISMPEVLETDEKFVSLFAVDSEEKNLVAIRVQGAFTVDWGDGVVENFVSNTTATHNYVYSNLSNDTITSDGYKQVVMIVTPQVGQHITAFYVVPWPTLDNHVNACYNFLDIVFSLPSATMDFYGNFNRQHLMRRMESFIMMSSCVSIGMYTQFANCYKLKRIVLRLATMQSNLNSAFHNCRSLVECSLFMPNTGPVRTDGMFRYCSALEKVFLSSAVITTALYMFEGCARLTSVPLLDTSLLTNATNMFNGCYALKSIPLFNLESLDNGTNMFANCPTLKSIPLFNLESLTNATNMFNGCYALKSIPLFNLESLDNGTNMFANCPTLKSIPLFNLESLTNGTNMFYNCPTLKSIPLFNLESLDNGTNMFNNCPTLKSIPLFNLESLTNATSMFQGCPALKSISIRNIKVSWVIISAQLEYAALKNVIELSLFPGVTAQTLTITGNPGAAAIMAAIAAGTITLPSGWTIVN